MSSRKQLWLLVGGNGAGKSTFYRMYLEPLGLPFVNADILARLAYPDAPEVHSYDAALLAEQMRNDLLLAGTSFCFETVYSHPSKIDFVARAKALGYEIVMVVIHLQHTSLNLARVAERVSEGGHTVPDEKVISRIPRTLRHVKTSIPLCDRVQVYDNSFESDPFRPVLIVKNGAIAWSVNPRPDWVDSLLQDKANGGIAKITRSAPIPVRVSSEFIAATICKGIRFKDASPVPSSTHHLLIFFSQLYKP